jgi:hypothetical protein
MSSSDGIKGSSEAKTSLVDLLNIVLRKYFVATAIVPVLVVAADIGGLSIISPEFASAVVRGLSSFWPTLLQQYDAVSAARGALHAANYALFFLALLATIPIGVAYAAHTYQKKRRLMKETNERDVLALAVFLVGAILVLFLDEVKVSPKPIFNFSVDNIGLYFIRQYALFLGLFLAVIASFIVTVRIIDYSAGGLDGTDSGIPGPHNDNT